jgi:glycosyltransferase involved in cell wall biosynthesis
MDALSGPAEGPVGPSPVLTAAVIVGRQGPRAERCLRHLLAQTALARMEIVAVDISSEGQRIARSDHASVRWIHRPGLATMGAARTECVRAALGEIVAFIEDHSYADPGWAEAVIAAFDQPVDLVSYAMMNANPERLLCRTFMMVEYGRWHDPAISGFIPISASNNVAYRRRALDPYLSRLHHLFEAEYVLHRDMQGRGARIWLAADAKVAHENWKKLGDGVRANNVMKRLLAAGRAAEGRGSLSTRAAWAAAMIVTPPLHVARLARSLAPRPVLWPLFVMSLPLMALVYGASAYSEAMGYLLGAGDSSARFRDLEVSIARED